MAGPAKRLAETRLAWRHRLHALRGLWGGILIPVCFAALILAFTAWTTRVMIEPATPVQGTIVRIGLISGGDKGDDLMILARMPDGALRQGRMAIARQALRGCRVGGPVIFLFREGDRWSLSGTPCLIDGREIG